MITETIRFCKDCGSKHMTTYCPNRRVVVPNPADSAADVIRGLRTSADALLHQTMFKDHPAQSQLVKDAIAAADTWLTQYAQDKPMEDK